MEAIETTAQFDADGKIKLGSLPTIRNRKAKVIFLLTEIESQEWFDLSSQSLAKAYSDGEPDYSLSLVTEPNINYGA
ncbi:MAG: hypothetical protein JST43_10965 [Bacteroidetes bacterium]|nr:hypothetical protein [Bacteroidota bacterium]MBS1540096.1 hypothetical protein [Bacteroidota bacterium]